MVHLPNFVNEKTEVQASYQGAKINNGILNRFLGNLKIIKEKL